MVQQRAPLFKKKKGGGAHNHFKIRFHGGGGLNCSANNKLEFKKVQSYLTHYQCINKNPIIKYILLLIR